jgi:hypothetical protein
LRMYLVLGSFLMFPRIELINNTPRVHFFVEVNTGNLVR